MPQIEFAKKRAAITVEKGANLMKALLAAGLPVASSCHGEGICSKCRIRIVAGRENLSVENRHEIDLKSRLKIGEEFRISCQTEVLGNIVIDATYW